MIDPSERFPKHRFQHDTSWESRVEHTSFIQQLLVSSERATRTSAVQGGIDGGSDRSWDTRSFSNSTKTDPGQAVTCGGDKWHPRETYPVTAVVFVDFCKQSAVHTTQLGENPRGVESFRRWLVVDSGGSAVGQVHDAGYHPR